MDMLPLQSSQQQVEQVVPALRQTTAITWNVGVKLFASVIATTLAFMLFTPLDAIFVMAMMVAVSK
jgi:hypothetical protein